MSHGDIYFDVERTRHKITLVINERSISTVIIDQHYRENHSETMNDELILKILAEISGQFFPTISKDNDFEYFKAEPIILDEKPYRLIFLLFIHKDTLGVINCFRVQRSKYE